MISEKYNKTYTVSWDKLHKDSKILAMKLAQLEDFKGILIVTRGGLVPAAIIARELDIRLIDTLCVVSYDWQKMQTDESTIIKNTSLTDDGKGWLIIDDLVDTGSTLKLLRGLFPKAIFATVYAKPTGKVLTDYCVKEVSQETWILFPWDTEVQYTKPIKSKNNK